MQLLFGLVGGGLAGLVVLLFWLVLSLRSAHKRTRRVVLSLDKQQGAFRGELNRHQIRIAQLESIVRPNGEPVAVHQPLPGAASGAKRFGKGGRFLKLGDKVRIVGDERICEVNFLDYDHDKIGVLNLSGTTIYLDIQHVDFADEVKP